VRALVCAAVCSCALASFLCPLRLRLLAPVVGRVWDTAREAGPLVGAAGDAEAELDAEEGETAAAEAEAADGLAADGAEAEEEAAAANCCDTGAAATAANRLASAARLSISA
jgi:hypothetical protein